MALRRNLAARILHLTSATAASPCAASSASRRAYLASPDTASRGFFQRILQRRALNNHSSVNSSSPAVNLPEFMTFPVGDRLREKLWEISIGADRIRLNRPPPAKETVAAGASLTVEDARKIMRAAQMEKVKERLRSVPESAISYSEFVRICTDACGGEHRGLEFAKLLDDTASVIVWGNIVFLRPDQVAKTMESLITGSIAMPNDPRRKELEQMENQKAQIDKRAQTMVRRELYSGLGLLVAQTVGFMRLTFWELSWDVMEPICFFVTSMHFALAYTFFLRTSTEPSFEGFFRTRFRAKQAQLMKLHNFDSDRYERLSKVFYRTEKFPEEHLKSLCYM